MYEFLYDKNHDKEDRFESQLQLTHSQQKEINKYVKGTHANLKHMNQKVYVYKAGLRVKAQLRTEYIKESRTNQKQNNEIKDQCKELEVEKIECQERLDKMFGKNMIRKLKQEQEQMKYRIIEIDREVQKLNRSMKITPKKIVNQQSKTLVEA